MELQEILKKKEAFKKACKWENILSKNEFTFLKEEIVKMNKKGISFTQISKLLKIERHSIRRWMKSIDYKIINNHNSLRIRENLFESVFSEEDAYWLGFIYADGYIGDKGQFSIGLKESDYSHLLKFADFCNFDKSKVRTKIKTNFPNSFSCRIAFATQHLKERFNNIGIIPRKSLILTFPTFLKKDLERHFIRGYFDGDGCISLVKLKTKSPAKSVSLLGTKEFLESLLNIFTFDTVLVKKDKRHQNNTYSINFNRKDGIKFLDYMYKDSNIYLERKYNKYL